MNTSSNTRYAVKVENTIVSPACATPAAAAELIKILNEAHQAIAEVVPVDGTGKEILFG